MSKHTKEPWPNPEYNNSDISRFEWWEIECVGKIYNEANANRIVQCVNACAGMDDPESEIQSLRTKLKSLRTWIIKNTVDVEGQDGTRWNCIERDEILEYLNNQNKQQ